MRQRRNIEKTSPPSWWRRCALLALAGLMMVAPTWHICSMGASGTVPGQMGMTHQACMMPEASSGGNITNQLNNQPIPEDFCLARMLQHVLGNSQFRLVLNFSAVTISTFTNHPADTPLIRAFPVMLARGPPSHLL